MEINYTAAIFHLARGKAAYQEAMFAEAYKCFMEALRFDPTCSEASTFLLQFEKPEAKTKEQGKPKQFKKVTISTRHLPYINAAKVI